MAARTNTPDLSMGFSHCLLPGYIHVLSIIIVVVVVSPSLTVRLSCVALRDLPLRDRVVPSEIAKLLLLRWETEKYIIV